MDCSHNTNYFLNVPEINDLRSNNSFSLKSEYAVAPSRTNIPARYLYKSTGINRVLKMNATNAKEMIAFP